MQPIAIFSIIVAASFYSKAHSEGKAPIVQNDQSESNVYRRNLFHFKDLNASKHKKPGNNLMHMFKYKPEKNFWTKEKFLALLKKLGIFDNKDLKLFKAPPSLVKELKNSKNNTIDEFIPCTLDPKGRGCTKNGIKIELKNQLRDKHLPKKLHDEDEIGQEIHDDELEEFYSTVAKQHLDENNRGSNDVGTGKREDNGVINALVAKRRLSQPEKRGGLLVSDLCQERFSYTFVLAHASYNFVYKIPNVHCPSTFCHSNFFGMSLGRCGKKIKRMTVFQIDHKNRFRSKTVTIGCACECLIFNQLA